MLGICIHILEVQPHCLRAGSVFSVKSGAGVPVASGSTSGGWTCALFWASFVEGSNSFS